MEKELDGLDFVFDSDALPAATVGSRCKWARLGVISGGFRPVAATAFEFDARAAGTLLIARLRLCLFFHFLRHLGLLCFQDVLHEQVFQLLDRGRGRIGLVFSFFGLGMCRFPPPGELEVVFEIDEARQLQCQFCLGAAVCLKTAQLCGVPPEEVVGVGPCAVEPGAGGLGFRAFFETCVELQAPVGTYNFGGVENFESTFGLEFGFEEAG